RASSRLTWPSTPGSARCAERPKHASSPRLRHATALGHNWTSVSLANQRQKLAEKGLSVEHLSNMRAGLRCEDCAAVPRGEDRLGTMGHPLGRSRGACASWLE